MESILIVSSVMLWVIMIVNLFLTFALIRRVNAAPGGKASDGFVVETIPAGQQAPNFTAQTLQGKQVTLADYAQRTMVLVFFSPTCHHCRKDMPVLEALRTKAQQSGVELLLVSDTETKATQAYILELSITLPVLVAPRESNPFLEDYKVGGVPFYYIITADGKIQIGGVLGDPQWQVALEKWG